MLCAPPLCGSPPGGRGSGAPRPPDLPSMLCDTLAVGRNVPRQRAASFAVSSPLPRSGVDRPGQGGTASGAGSLGGHMEQRPSACRRAGSRPAGRKPRGGATEKSGLSLSTGSPLTGRARPACTDPWVGPAFRRYPRGWTSTQSPSGSH